MTRIAAPWTAAALLFAAGCGGDSAEPSRSGVASTRATATPPPTPAQRELRLRRLGGKGIPVAFEASDGVRLQGRLFGEGEVAIVLSHMGDPSNDQTEWFDSAVWLAGIGYRVLTYNTRGICPGGFAGCSAGSWTLSQNWRDIVGADRFVRAKGATRVVLIGASVGSMGSIIAAPRLRHRPAALVAISGVEVCCGYELGRREIRATGVPMLFIAADRDSWAATSTRRFYSWAREPKAIRIVAGTGLHGTDLLLPEQSASGELQLLIQRFLTRHAAP